MSKLLKLFGVLWGTSQVESNSIDAADYALEDACKTSLTIFVVFWPQSLRYYDNLLLVEQMVLKTEEYFHSGET